MTNRLGDPDHLDFGVLLALAYSGFVDELRAGLAEHGYDDLNWSFGYVARALAETPLTLTELAARLEVTSPGALKIVDDMEEHGYLERVADAVDGRAKRLHLTKRGHAALLAARALHRRFEAKLAGRVGARQAATCRKVLEEIVLGRGAAGRPPALRPV